MSLDLTLCIVPREVNAILSKAKVNPAYAEWISFIPSILQNGALQEQGDPAIREMNRDVAALKKCYHYSAADDHLADEGRAAASADHLLDALIDETGALISKQILWKGGSNICDACKAVQGLPVKLYGTQEIESITAFLERTEETGLLRHYNYEKMLRDGVYKPADPERKDELIAYCIKMRKFFERAYKQQGLVLKVID